MIPRTRLCLCLFFFSALALPLRARGQVSTEETVSSMSVAEGLSVTPWANEPGVIKPTNIDIDERGRIWATEGDNYRRVVRRPEGDRIVILEDTHHTGVCDSYKVFVQDKALFSPLGICKLGNKLYVSQSPNLLVYTIDASGEHPVGPPEVWFTGFGGVNHDHGLHAGVFGPDGKFYFNCGNEGGLGYIKNAKGEPVVDVRGNEVGAGAKVVRGKPRGDQLPAYQEGLAFRCNLDGSEFEVLGNDFRNNFKLCVDSFGTVWQSDNDDDGNRGVRINYVMEGGAFGYKGPKGSAWSRDRDVFKDQTAQEAHWHLRWPGFVPNLLNTGAGSPTGIVCYEGELLPALYRGALIHCDAGPNVVRAYVTESDGGGYKAQMFEMVKANDRWFRPSDVSVSPDGALYIADWYDPGVGGHNTGDVDPKKVRGRVYRLAPQGYKPAETKLALDTVEGQIAALCSSNNATRYLAYTKLRDGGDAAVTALKSLYDTSPNQRWRARALWLLSRSPRGSQFVSAALHDGNPDIRVTALRAARQIKMDMVQLAAATSSDESLAVRREVALAMQFEPDDRAVPVLSNLAGKYKAGDRWSLEAIGIGAKGREAALLDVVEKQHVNQDAKAVAELGWRLKLEPVPGGPSGPATAINEPAKPLIPGGNAPDVGVSSVVETPHKTRDGALLPPIAQLARMHGKAQDGEAVFKNMKAAACIRCHQVGNEGQMIGPPLTAIGQKLSKAQLYEAILYPSAAIEMGYETWVVKTKSGEVFSGLKVEDNGSHITIKDTDGKAHDIAAAEVEKKVKQNISLMPEGLSEAMTEKDLVNLVEYLSQRKG